MQWFVLHGFVRQSFCSLGFLFARYFLFGKVYVRVPTLRSNHGSEKQVIDIISLPAFSTCVIRVFEPSCVSEGGRGVGVWGRSCGVWGGGGVGVGGGAVGGME